MNDHIRARYETSGMQGVFDSFGSSGVRGLLSDWRCRQRAMTIDEYTTVTVGADFCYWHAGGGAYSKGEIGVRISLSGSSLLHSGPAFTMRRNDTRYFKVGLDRVARQDEFREGDGQTLRIPIGNYSIGLAKSGAGEIQVSRSGEQAPTDVITIWFGSGSVAIEGREVWKLQSLVDEALEDVAIFVAAEERGKRVIERSQRRDAY